MGAALVGVDGVGEGVHRLGVAGVPLHRHLDLVALTLAGEVDDAGVDRLLGPVDVLDVVHQSAGVVEGAAFDLVRGGLLGGLLLCGFRCLRGIADHLVDDLFRGHPLIGEGDGQALVEKGHLLQAARDGLEVVIGGLEDIRVRPESDRGARLLGLLALLDAAWHGALVSLEPFVPVAGDVGFQPGRQGVDHRDADAVQAAGDLVGTLLELAAGVQNGHHDVDGGDAGRLVHLDGDAAAIVADLDATVLEQAHIDLFGESRHRLVDGVIDDLPHQMVQAPLSGRADVHAGTFANGLETFEDGDLRGAVLRRWFLRLLGSHGRAGLLGVDFRAGYGPVPSLPAYTDRTDSGAAFLHT